MANDVIGFPHSAAAATLYALIRDDDGQVWETVGPSFEAYLTANLANYDIALTEQGTASQFYTFTFPSAITAGVFSVAVYLRAGGAPAEGDIAVAEGAVEWDGSAVVPLSTILADTNELQVDWIDGGRLDLLLDAIPTTAMRGTDGASTHDAAAVWTSGTRTLTATGLDLILVDGKALPVATQIMAAATIGIISGAGTGTEVFKGLDKTTTRATVTVDTSGNRSAITYI